MITGRVQKCGSIGCVRALVNTAHKRRQIDGRGDSSGIQVRCDSAVKRCVCKALGIPAPELVAVLSSIRAYIAVPAAQRTHHGGAAGCWVSGS